MCHSNAHIEARSSRAAADCLDAQVTAMSHVGCSSNIKSENTSSRSQHRSKTQLSPITSHAHSM